MYTAATGFPSYVRVPLVSEAVKETDRLPSLLQNERPSKMGAHLDAYSLSFENMLMPRLVFCFAIVYVFLSIDINYYVFSDRGTIFTYLQRTRTSNDISLTFLL